MGVASATQLAQWAVQLAGSVGVYPASTTAFWVNGNILFSFPSEPGSITTLVTQPVLLQREITLGTCEWPFVCWVMKMWASHRPTGATNDISVATINVIGDTCVKYLWESNFTHANTAVSALKGLFSPAPPLFLQFTGGQRKMEILLWWLIISAETWEQLYLFH